MKRVVNIFLCTICALIIVLSLVFTVIEFRLILSCDWKLYDNYVNGFVRHFFRFILSLFSLSISLIEIINLKVKNEKIEKMSYYNCLSLLIMAIVISAFATNYVGLVCVILTLCLNAIKCIGLLINYKK